VFPIREGVPERVQRRVATPDPFQQIGLVPFVKTVHDRMTVEIRRGCTRGCRFCQPGMLTRPARDVEPDKVRYSSCMCCSWPSPATCPSQHKHLCDVIATVQPVSMHSLLPCPLLLSLPVSPDQH
jgi:hypothetical protein